MNTYIIEGGIGKQVAFTAIIDALVKKDKEKIQILSPYVDIFGGNTNIKYALDANTIPVHDKRILDSQNICYCEPYKANFIKGDHHIIQSYCKLFGVKYEEKMRPKMFTDHYKIIIPSNLFCRVFVMIREHLRPHLFFVLHSKEFTITLDDMVIALDEISLVRFAITNVL